MHQECLAKGAALMTAPLTAKLHLGDQTSLFDDVSADFRWFLLASEAYDIMKSEQASHTSAKLPFQVKCLLQTFSFFPSQLEFMNIALLRWCLLLVFRLPICCKELEQMDTT